MVSGLTEPAIRPMERVRRSMKTRLSALAALPALNPGAAHELWTEMLGGHAVSDDQAHLRAAIAWIVRAQDATTTGGISRGYSLTHHREFGHAGWQPAYPETTGYIIPTLYAASHMLESPMLAVRATSAARWLIDVQLPTGAARGGTIDAPPSPAIFNTGQVLFGWLAALEHDGDTRFEAAADRAARFLLEGQDPDGNWRRSQSVFADDRATLYNARTAWALAEAGLRLGRGAYSAAAQRALRACLYLQHRNGWLPACCLNDPERPLLHTLAYAIRGLIEGGNLLSDADLVYGGARAARAIANAVSESGWLPGRFAADWTPASTWSCLTGQAQMVNVWFRLYEITDDDEWLEPIPRVIQYLKATQDRATANHGRRGGIKGSLPVTGEYGRFEILSWATKFFADMLMRSISVYDKRRAPTALFLA